MPHQQDGTCPPAVRRAGGPAAHKTPPAPHPARNRRPQQPSPRRVRPGTGDAYSPAAPEVEGHVMDVRNGDIYRFQESLHESHLNLLKVVQSETDSLTNGHGRTARPRWGLPCPET